MNINISSEDNIRSPIAESFRSIRTNLQFSNVDNPIRSFVVTSSIPGEGKSTVAFNLAVSMAQNYKKVILIDADLRKPMLNSYIGFELFWGLTNIIAQDMGYQEVVQSIENINNLDIILSGPLPPNPSELLGSEKMKSLLTDLKQDYEMIILDSPPVGMFTDAAVISTMVDGAILVCGAGKTKRGDISRSIDSLNKVNSNIIGVIINKVKQREKTGYSSYYGKKKKK